MLKIDANHTSADSKVSLRKAFFILLIFFMLERSASCPCKDGRRNQSAKPETLFVFIEKDRSAYTAAN